MAEHSSSIDKKHEVATAVAAKMEQAANTGKNVSTDFTIHITDSGDTVRTVERICQGGELPFTPSRLDDVSYFSPFPFLVLTWLTQIPPTL